MVVGAVDVILLGTRLMVVGTEALTPALVLDSCFSIEMALEQVGR